MNKLKSKSSSVIRSTPDKSSHGKPKHGCANPDASKRTQRMKHALHPESEDTFVCAYCKGVFENSNDLGNHLDRHFCTNLKKAENEESRDEDEESEDEDVESEDEDDEAPWLDDGIIEFQYRFYAEAALRYMSKLAEGNKYELVEPGPAGAASISRGPIVHVNFKAKAKDCPGAPVETFFAQMRMHKALVVDLCVSLGPSQELPHWRKADLGGCAYCGDAVRHPAARCEKLIKGVDHEDASWLYGDGGGNKSF